MSVEINDLVKIYGEQRAVDGVSFTITKGEVVGFLGPNGAGKSTTMKIMAAYLSPTTGSAKVCGYDVSEYPQEVKKRIGYLPENNPLYYDMYIKEYLEYVGKLYFLKGGKLKLRIDEVVESTGLTQEKKKKIGQLSKGYKQRVGLAQALIHDPEVLILDEPTNGFDPNQLVEIRKLIKNVAKQKTVILSTHIMQEVQILCDRVLIINAGKLVADNPIKQLTSQADKEFHVFIQFNSGIDVTLLEQIPGIKSVILKEEGKYLIISNNRDPRSDIFKVASSNDWELLEMKLEEVSLETVFQTLTNLS